MQNQGDEILPSTNFCSEDTGGTKKRKKKKKRIWEPEGQKKLKKERQKYNSQAYDTGARTSREGGSRGLSGDPLVGNGWNPSQVGPKGISTRVGAELVMTT